MAGSAGMTGITVLLHLVLHLLFVLSNTGVFVCLGLSPLLVILLQLLLLLFVVSFLFGVTSKFVGWANKLGCMAQGVIFVLFLQIFQVPCESCQNGHHNEPLPVLPGNELNQSSPKLKTMVVKTINCHHFICLFYQACAISA